MKDLLRKFFEYIPTLILVIGGYLLSGIGSKPPGIVPDSVPEAVPQTLTPLSDIEQPKPKPKPKSKPKAKPQAKVEAEVEAEVEAKPKQEVTRIDTRKPVLELSNSSDPLGVGLAGVYTGILNKTNSWDALISQAFGRLKGDALIDIHFNKYENSHSGPLMIYSKAGKDLAIALQCEFIEIYEENNWTYDKEMDLRRVPGLGLITRAEKGANNKAVVISEFGYVDDPRNPIAEYIQSRAGQMRIARAYYNAARGLGMDKIIISAGHHGDRGTEGAKTGSYHETQFGEDIINALFSLRHPVPTSNPAKGYHHVEGGDDVSVNDWGYTSDKPKKTPVFRKPNPG